MKYRDRSIEKGHGIGKASNRTRGLQRRQNGKASANSEKKRNAIRAYKGESNEDFEKSRA